MDLSTLLLASVAAGLFLSGTGLMAAMVVLERPAAPDAARQGKRRDRCRGRATPIPAS